MVTCIKTCIIKRLHSFLTGSSDKAALFQVCQMAFSVGNSHGKK